MAGEAGTVIALAVRKSQRRVVGHFCALHALSAPDAVQYVPDGAMDARQFARLRAAGIIHEAIPGHYWIDLVALKAADDARRERLVPVVIAVVVVIAAALLLFYQG